jgi:hypothetical protein
MRQRPNADGVYVLAAAVLATRELARVREELAGLRHGKRRFHWRMEEPKVKRHAVLTVEAIDLMHVAVVGRGLDNGRQERGRRRCLERLLWELDQLGLSAVTLDQRTETLNERNRRLVNALAVRGVLSPSLRVGFQRSFDGVDGELLLWIPDVVAGAVAAACGDGRREYLEPIAHQVVEVEVDLGAEKSAKPRS